MDESFLMGCYQLGYICSYIFSTVDTIQDLILFWAWEYILERSLCVDARRIEKGRESDSYMEGPFHFFL